MPRFGVLSDLAVKAARPEFFPLDLQLTADSQPANLHHHHLKGAKIKIKKGITPRYAMNDLNNFATFTAPQAKERAKFNAVQEVQLYEISTQTSSTLQMFGMSKLEGSSVFDKHAPEYSNAFSKRIKSTFANIVEPEELGSLVSSLFPSGFIKNNKYRDYDVLENLTRLYRNEPEQTGIVQRAYDASSGVAGKKLFPQLEAVEEEPEREPEQETERENNEE